MNNRDAVLAVVGLCGVGKSEVTRLVSDKFGYSVVYFGGQITTEVARRGLTAGPDSERMVREELRQTFGMDAIARLAESQIRKELSKGNRVAIDGIYSFAEVTYLRKVFDNQILLIAVHSQKCLRYNRMADRPVRPLSQAQVDERDLREIEALDKATPIALADYHIVNDGSFSDLSADVNQAVLCLAPSIFSIAS